MLERTTPDSSVAPGGASIAVRQRSAAAMASSAALSMTTAVRPPTA